MAITDGADVGFGLAITFQTGLLAQISNVKMADLGKRSVAKFVHMALTNGWIKKIPSRVQDPGKITVGIFFETQRLAAYKTAMRAAKETVTITFPIPAGGLTAGTIACSGFCTGFSPAFPVEDGMTADVEIELTDEPTITSAA